MTGRDNKRRALRIAIVGTRGIPACYGGFETFAEQLSLRLAARSHDVTVYCRSRYSTVSERSYLGVRRVVLPAVPHKYLDTISHTCLSVLHGLAQGYDIVLICNAINAVFAPLARLAGQKVALNVDGIERQRKKWNRLGKLAYRLSERLAGWFPHVLVADAQVIARYYRERYAVESAVIPYGAPLTQVPPGGTLRRWDLSARRYLLFVSRLEPENHAHTTIAAFLQSGSSIPLVVVGDAPYSRNYIDELHRMASAAQKRNGSVIFTGAVYGEGFEELISSALLYVQATEVGGTHPALLQAMGAGNVVIANDTPEHREVLADTGVYYTRNDATSLAAQIRAVIAAPEQFEPLRAAARDRVRRLYSWESVTDLYEALFRRMASQ